MFEIPIEVTAAHIDELGHVNNVEYLRWVQDVAVAHWVAEAPAEDQAAFLWVVLRHEIDYKKPAHLGDALVARTWVGAASRLRYERHTEILRPSDSVTLAKAITFWCPVDRLTRRPKPVSAEIFRLFAAQS